MVENSTREYYQQLFEKIGPDFYTEVMVYLLLEMGLIEPEQVYFKPAGTFKRGYKKDLEQVEVLDSKNKDKPNLFFEVNREGLYDMLPEGLFHNNLRKNYHINTEESVKELKLHQEEEKSARLFFLPLEQEFYRHRVQIEKNEHAVAVGFTDPVFQELFSQFWQLPAMPLQRKLNLLYLIPLASRITGNLDLTRKAYELVLQEPVKIDPVASKAQYFGSYPGLHEAVLGHDLILDREIDDHLPALKITVGPLQNPQNLVEYINENHFSTLIDILESYFIPLDVSTEVELLFDRSSPSFILNEEEHLGRLSYSTYI